MPDLPPPPVAPPTWLDRCRPALERLRAEPRRLLGVAGGLLAVVVLAALFASAWPTSPPPVELGLPRAGPAAPADNDGPSEGPPGAPRAEAYVHVAGAVSRPGVYRVRPDARVADVVDAAGGATPEADLHRVNLAARVGDGQRVVVPRHGEAAPASDESAGAGAARAGVEADDGSPPAKVDLNTATMEELDRLPGIGPATAQAILDLRRRKGRFRSVDELLEVRGIGEAKLEQLRPRVQV